METSHYDMPHTVFDLPDMLESVNNGCSRISVDQLLPTTGSVSNSVVGTGGASGITTFQWAESSNWWLPSESYFQLQLKFAWNNVTILPNDTHLATYCDNFVSTLFNQITSYVNTQPLETLNQPWIVDTALTYAKCHWNFLKSSASMTRVGEPLSTRLVNVRTNGGPNAGTGAIIEVSFRPSIALLAAKILPPGAQFRVDFNWQSSAIYAFETLAKALLTTDVASTTYSVTVNSFTFFKASVSPAPGISLPPNGVIELCPAASYQSTTSSSNQMQQTFAIPATTNRIIIVFQDTCTLGVTTTPPVDFMAGIGTGYNPVTSFTNRFLKTGSAVNATFTTDSTVLSQLWISLPEIGYTAPKPVYSFNTGNNTDLLRAYSDWCHTTQGTITNFEGSIPFGNTDPTLGTTIIAPGASAGGVTTQAGDLNNYQQYSYITPGGAGTPVAKTYNQTTRWGWAGSRPGPMFAFPVIRPNNQHVSTGTLYAQFADAVISATVTFIASYSMALVVEHAGNGQYSYKLVQGV
jgi:hypothetical protein